MAEQDQQHQDTGDQQQGADGSDQGTDDQGQDETPARLEQRLRAERREAVEERDALRERVQALQRAEATRLAAEVLADADDLWSIGAAQVADLVDDDGTVSAQRVCEAAEAVVEARGERFAKARRVTDYDGGARQTARKPAAVGWGAVLNPEEHARTRGGRR